MPRPVLEVADIFRLHGPEYRTAFGDSMTRAQFRVMRAIEICRTAELGGHVEQCDRCGRQVISYNSCRNRHCPKCGSLEKAAWLEARQAELLQTQYFHVVFTVPEVIAPILLQNKTVGYNILFRAVAETLQTVAGDPKHLGAQIGFLAVLHTWGQNLSHHPHLHCVIPGGGVSPDRKAWVSCRRNFFLPVRVLSRAFRGKFLYYLNQAVQKHQITFHGKLQHLTDPATFMAYVQTARKSEWVVYAKAPFGGPQQVLDYLGRYTHRVAISNHRLLRLENHRVTFRWKNYRNNNRIGTMTLDANEFIRRFLLHVLPGRFVRIRQFGFLANRNRTENIALCRKLIASPESSDSQLVQNLDWKSRYEKLTGESLRVCPSCHQGQLLCIEIIPALPRLTRAPP